MANYFLDENGSLTTKKKKKQGKNFLLQNDGSIVENVTPGTTTKTTLTTPQLTDAELHTQAERNIAQKFGTYEQFAAEQSKGKTKVMSDLADKTSKTMYQKLIEEEKNRLASGSEFYGITNKGYQEYLDNFSKNAKDEKQTAWLEQQRKNLDVLKNSDLRLKVEQAVFGKKTSLGINKNSLINALSKDLNISFEQAESLFDTVEREQNAEHSKTLEKNAEKMTDKGLLGKAAAHFLSIGANMESTLGVLDSIGDSIKNKVSGEYAPIDTNAPGYAAGNFRDRARGNIEADIVGEEEEDAPLWRKGLGTIYQGASSMFDSLGQGLVLGPTGAILAMGGQAATGTTKETFERTGSNSKAITTGLVSGGIEALTEKMGLDNMWDILQNSGKAALRSTLVNILAQSGIEGVEEMTSEVLNTVADYLINQTDSNISKSAEEHKKSGLSDKEAWKKAFWDAAKQVGKAGLTGAVAGIFGGAAGSALSTSYSKNEKQVIEKEVERRISEKQGKVTAKEKAEIRKDVQKDLEKGYIDIDTIESTLGGETLKKYNSVVEQEEKLAKELEELGNQPNTVANAKKYEEVSAKLKELQDKDEKTTLKEQLSKEVSDMTVNDRFLRESYNEKGRRSQAYEADVNTYDEKQRAIVQNAIDSGILNNTRRTHEFVDMIAKISADKGVSFDFTDNKRLKESGFAKEGVSVNGYIKDGNVTINVNSAKALNKVVGHEITHVLEGSDLYAELREAVKAYATTKGEYNSKLEAITKLYEGVEGANIEQELTADLIGEYLFTDEAFVKQLSAQNRNIFQKIYDEIKYLCKVVSSGSKEAKQLEKVKKLFDEVYRDSAKIDVRGTKYSIAELNDGRKYVDVDTDQMLFDGLDESNKRAMAKYVIQEYFPAGTEVEMDGETFYVSNRTSKEYAYAEKNRGKKRLQQDKMRASTELDNLVKVSNFVANDSSKEVKERHPEAIGGIDTYETMFKVQDRWYKGTVNIINRAEEREIYDVTKIKSIGANEVLNNENELAAQPDASTNSISQNQQKTTKNQKLSLGDDIAPTGNWNVKGSDITLDDSTPIRKDSAPIPDNWNELIQQAVENEEMRLRESESQKIKNIQAKIKGLQMSKDVATHNFDESIARKEAEYEELKRKDTKKASTLQRQIRDLEARKQSTLADHDRRIAGQRKGIEKIEQQARARHAKRKMDEYREIMRQLIGDTSTWEDKKLGLSYRMNTLRRNLRDIVKDENGNPDYEKADRIYEALQGAYNHNEAELNREANRIKQIFVDMKINKRESVYIQMLGEYKYNPDTTLTPEVMKEYYDKYKDKINTTKVDEAIEKARSVYDNLFQRVNAVLREQGFKEIGYKQGYFPHFTEEQSKLAKFMEKVFNWKTQNNDIPTDIAGLTEQFNPNRSYQSFDKHRTGDDTVYDFLKGMDTYVQGALDWIYHIEDIQKRRALENEIRYQHSPEGLQKEIDEIRKNPFLDAEEMQQEIDKKYENFKNPLGNFVQDLRKGTNVLAGKKDSADRNMESALNRTIYSTMTNVSNRITGNMVVGSISSAITNFIPITQSWGQVSPISSLKAMKDTILSVRKDDGVIDKSDFLTNRLHAADNLYKTGWDKTGEAVGFLMEVVDNFTSQTVWRSKYMENIQNGMSEAEAIKDADQFAENVIAGRSRGNMPTIFNEKNPVSKVLTAFQLEVANQYGYMFKDMPQDMKNESVGQLVKGYLTMYVGAYAYNALYSSLAGRDAAFDPIGILEDLLRDLFGDDKEEEPLDAVVNLVTNIAEEIPFIGGLMGGGRIPISSALPYDGLTIASLTEMMGDVSEGNWENIGMEWLNPVYYLAMPMGGGQLKKSVEGTGMFIADDLFPDAFPIAGSYTNNGKLRYSVEETPANIAQAAVFGQYANENAREYFDEGRSPLNEKKTQELVDLDIPISEYWDIQDGLKEHETLADKIDYVAGLDLPIAKKNILANNLADRKEPIDLTDYDLYGNIEELDYATSNPEKYKVAKAVGGYSSYKTYTKALNGIKANKDEKGNTISGSRKTKVVNYINGLSADYGTKLILFKQQFEGDDTYNKEIVEYLNKRNDLSYSDVETILKELGFEVDSNGNVRW
ncbi:MAG: hypothetical protein IJA54_07940 [Tyzzerella sp.]|nr:hypothetical protein [Tyzzerella sp.]